MISNTTTGRTKLQESYAKDGFVIIPNLIPPSQFESLKAAAARATSKTRSGTWTKRRIVGKQFPPYDGDDPDSWGVQHLMDPELGEPVFAEWYASEDVKRVAMELMECHEDDLQMELFNLLINPDSHEFALRWHRDDVRENATEDEESAALTTKHWGVQWNTALYTDSCLYIVPGSHAAARTPEQRAQSSTQTPPRNPLDMPGAIQVTLQAGDSVFYNNNILHTATYNPTSRRATLHACMGDARGGSARARNILQHDLEWMKSEAFAETLSGDAKAISMRRRLLDMANTVSRNEIQYSQEE